MPPEANTLVGALGFASEDRVVIVHQDDVGMCHGANVAFAELAGRGFVTCGSVMVPCPWFRELAEIAVSRPELDIGVHLTLTSEWRQYRWRPLTGSGRASGLADPDGFMWTSVKLLRRHAVPEAVEAELRAQIEAALAAGIDVTHFDPHMGAARAPEFAEIYYRLGREYDVPVTSTRSFSTQAATHRELKPDEPERKGPPLFDVLHETPWTLEADGIIAYRRILDSLEPGLSFLAIHCNAPGDIEVIDPERAHCRMGEYAMFKDPWFLAYVDKLDLKFVGLREIRAAMRQPRPLAA
jgi:chitin disaccharide deacetylase